MNYLQTLIEKSTKIQKNFIVFIIGDYGDRKTETLSDIINTAKKDFNQVIFPAYFSLKSEEKSKAGLDFLFKIFKTIDFDKLVEGKSPEDIQNAIENIPDDLHEPKAILKVIYQGEEAKRALYFLRGELKPTYTQLEKLKIIRKIENIEIAKEYLAGVLCFIKALGYKSLLLAVDEFDYLFNSISRTHRNIYLALLRGLYDFPMGTGLNIGPDRLANTVFLITVSKSGWGRLQQIGEKRESEVAPIQALMRRATVVF